jgi:predicted branched-subunit amino acid permease
VRDWVAGHKVLFTLAVGCVVAAVTLPIEASGFRPMWPVQIAVTVLAGAAAVLLVRRRAAPLK